MNERSSTHRLPDEIQQALERLAHNLPVSPDVFRAVFANAEALRRLAALLQVHDLFEPPAEVQLDALPPLNVPVEDLALYAEQKLSDPARVAAVEGFLRAHASGALDALSAGEDTHLERRAAEDTTVETDPRRKRPHRS